VRRDTQEGGVAASRFEVLLVLAHDKAELGSLDPVRRFGEHRLGSPHEHRVVFIVVDDLAMPGLLGDRDDPDCRFKDRAIGCQHLLLGPAENLRELLENLLADLVTHHDRGDRWQDCEDLRSRASLCR